MSKSSSKTITDFSHLIAKATLDFTGREWVFKAINNWLADPKGSRYFLITGKPGSGKTSLASRLYQFSQGVAHPEALDCLSFNFLSAIYFCSASDSDPNSFTESLAMQLAKRYPAYKVLIEKKLIEVNLQVGEARKGAQVIGINNLNINSLNLVLGSVSPEDTFRELVRKPLEALCKNCDEQIFILVDSLDETLLYSGEVGIVELLTKTKYLPEQVRFIVTSRPETNILEALEEASQEIWEDESLSLKKCDLTSGFGLNYSLDDVKQYVLHVIKQQPQLANKLANDLSTETFANALKNKGDGNFLYVSYMLKFLATQNSLITLESMEELPDRLDGIYKFFIRRLIKKNNSCWINQYKPIVGVLAVAQKALTEKQLARFIGREEDRIRNELQFLYQFLDTDGSFTSKSTYAIYHRSFADLLLDADRAGGYWCKAEQQHQLIINYYKSGKTTWNQVNLEQIDEYGLRYMAFHLRGAGLSEELYKLLVASPDWMEIKFRYLKGDSSYLTDIELALNDFTDPLNTNELSIFLQLYMARQVVRERVNLCNNTNLATLVWLGKKEEAIDYAHLRFLPEEKIESLFEIYNALSKKEKLDSSLLNEIEKIARECENINLRLITFLKLAKVFDNSEPMKSKELLSEADQIAQTIESDRDEVLVQLAVTYASLKKIYQADRIVLLIDQDYHRVNAQCQLAIVYNQLSLKSLAESKFESAKNLTFSINFERERDRDYAIGHLASGLAQIGRFYEAEEIIKLISPFNRHFASDNLASSLVDFGHFSEARKKADSFEIREIKNRIYAQISEAYAKLKRFDESEAIIESIDFPVIKTQALSQLAGMYAKYDKIDKAKETLAQVQELSKLLKSPKVYLNILNQLAVILSQEKLTKEAKVIFLEAEQVADLIRGNDLNYSIALSQLASALAKADLKKKAKAIFKKAKATANSIENKEPNNRFKALKQLASALAKADLKKEAKAMFRKAKATANSIEDDQLIGRSIAFIELAAELERAQFKKESDTLFKEAKKIIYSFKKKQNISYSAWMLSELVIALSKSRYFEEAVQIIELTKDEPLAYNKALHQLAIDLKQIGKAKRYKCIAQLISNNEKDLFQKTSDLYFTLSIQNKYYVKAFKAREIHHIDEFLRILAAWQFFVCEGKNRSTRIVTNLVRIAAWANPYWKKINKLTSIHNLP